MLPDEPETPFLTDMLKKLGAKGHTLIFDEAHNLFSIDTLVSDLFKDGPCRIFLFSASSESALSIGTAAVTPATITAKYVWTPAAPTDEEVAAMVIELNKHLNMNINDVTFKVLYMVAGGNRDIFMHALHWFCEQKMKQADDSLAIVRAGLEDWTCSLLEALIQSRAVRANSGFEEVRNVPEEFVNVLAAGPQCIDGERRRPLTIGGLIVPLVPAHHSREFVAYDWTKELQTYAVSSSLRASYYRHFLESIGKHSMRCKYSPTTEVSTCAGVCARAFPLMPFTSVVQRPSWDAVDEKTSMASSLGQRGLAPEDMYNEAVVSKMQAQGFGTRTFPSAQSGGKIDHQYWKDNSDKAKEKKPDFGLEFVHFDGGRKEHIMRFTTMETYKQAKQNALVVLCTTQSQVDTVIKQDTKLPEWQQVHVDVIAVLVSTPHESYTMTVLPHGATEPCPPLVLMSDGVAKNIVVDGTKHVLKPAQFLDCIHVSLCAWGV